MKDKKKIAAIVTLVVGVITLIVGVVFLIVKLTAGPTVSDAEFLVESRTWALEDEPGVVWEFTEVGKGMLTTNGHENDYDFAWAIEDGKLRIQTEWLYTLDDVYEYKLDQGSGTLTLEEDGKTTVFRAVESVAE